MLPYMFFVYMYHTQYDLISADLEYTPNLPTTIYDVNNEIIAELYDEKRIPVKFDEIPNTVIAAFTTAEDKNFYNHTGLDYTGMLRALIIDIKEGSIKQGGSTITQQLIKQLYTHRKRTFERKIIEILLVKKIEESYTKDQIIEMYLNQIYFGHGVYGIKSAANFFFNKELRNLNIYEASLLALIPPAPNRYSPLRNPEVTFTRHRQILFNLIRNGYLSKKKALSGFEEFWSEYLDQLYERSPNEIARSSAPDKAPYVTDYLRQQLIAEYGENRVYRGGLKVFTTIDLRMQQIAHSHLSEQITIQQKISSRFNESELRKLEEQSLNTSETANIKQTAQTFRNFRENLMDELALLTLINGLDPLTDSLVNHRRFQRYQRQKAQVEGAFIALEPDTGKIRSMVGGRSFNYENQLNRATAAHRQPGSAFKPFVYAAGIDSNIINAATEFQDLPMVYNERTKTWAPSNASDKFSGPVLVRKAITRSINTIAVLAFEKIGGERIAKTASGMIGIDKSRFTIDPTLALGTSELTPLELATGFACFANRGIKVNPYLIEKIVDSSDTHIYNHTMPADKQVISTSTTYIMNSILQGVITGGTATATVRGRYGFTSPAAGKTGTNSEYRDAWFAGYTPDLVAVAWIGCDSQKFTLGPGQYGATVAAPVWARFMKDTAPIRRKKSFPGKPGTVISESVCAYSGSLPREGCPTITEYFHAGTGPTERCTSPHEQMRSIFDLF
jgi:penicillin-binding protein 1A